MWALTSGRIVSAMGSVIVGMTAFPDVVGEIGDGEIIPRATRGDRQESQEGKEVGGTGGKKPAIEIAAMGEAPPVRLRGQRAGKGERQWHGLFLCPRRGTRGVCALSRDFKSGLVFGRRTVAGAR